MYECQTEVSRKYSHSHMQHSSRQWTYWLMRCVHSAAGGLIQLLAGMWEMWKANTFAATAFSSYGGFWMGWALYGILKSVRPRTPICKVLSAYFFKDATRLPLT